MTKKEKVVKKEVKKEIPKPKTKKEGKEEVPQTKEKSETSSNPIENMFVGINDLPKVSWMKLFLYGEPGCGKTHFTLANSAKTLSVCAETEQAQATMDNVNIKGRLNQGTNFYPVRSVKDIRRLVRYLKKGTHGFKFIVLDTINEIQRIYKRELIQDGKERDLKVLNQAEWQVLIDATLQIVTSLRDIPNTHLIVVAHYNEQYDDQKKKYIRPSLQGKKLAVMVSGAMNLTGYMRKTVNGELDEREIIFNSDDTIMNKPHMRLQRYEQADLDYIMDKWSAKIPKDYKYVDWCDDHDIE